MQSLLQSTNRIKNVRSLAALARGSTLPVILFSSFFQNVLLCFPFPPFFFFLSQEYRAKPEDQPESRGAFVNSASESELNPETCMAHSNSRSFAQECPIDSLFFLYTQLEGGPLLIGLEGGALPYSTPCTPLSTALPVSLIRKFVLG